MAINIGLLAIIIDALPALINLSPLKKKTLYVNTPVNPRRITGTICLFFGNKSLPSILQIIKIRKLDAMANLKKEAENGPTSFATTLPAMKVPPQNIAVNINLT
jgi:hypothetical protein